MQFNYQGISIGADGVDAMMTWQVKDDDNIIVGEHSIRFDIPESGRVEDAVVFGYRLLRAELQEKVDWISAFLSAVEKEGLTSDQARHL
ncbi:hypothetical protein [Sphingomonas sp.]|uniref:hypothetical protein n=1 Tax=Sphingomonas sp. TaxID=28214 RepID=UPI003B3B117E